MPKIETPNRTETTSDPQDKLPSAIKPYTFHGMELSPTSTGEYLAICPFCDKDKFHLSPKSGLWDCKVCGEQGNAYTFLRKLWDLGNDTTPDDDYVDLMTDRGILSPESIIAWGVCRSPLTSEWLLPAYNVEGKLSQLYKFVDVYDKDKKRNVWITMATPRIDIEGEGEIRHQLFGANLVQSQHTTIYVCEGFWDGVAWWETLLHHVQGKKGPIYTESKSRNYLSTCAVVAVPGANSFRQTWCPLFSDKNVVFLYDNDHERLNQKTQQTIKPAGLTGTKKAIKVLMQASEPPKGYAFLKWGGKEEGFDTSLKNGLDIRDVMNEVSTIKARNIPLQRVLSWISPLPQRWIDELKDEVENSCKVVHCTEWKVLINAWKRALKWTRGLDVSLSFMTAIAASTDVPEDQIWGKVIGPPSSGKSTLCEALSVSKRHVYASSTMKSFYSGYKTDKEGTDDHSMINNVRNKTLVIKDGDTLLQNPKRDEILAQARDLYDRTSRANYANGLNRKYEGFSITIILCGTPSLRALDSSELGQRFIDCIIMDEISDELEISVNKRKQNSIRYMMTHLANGLSSGRDGETKDMMEAKGLTAGYLEYLRGRVGESVDTGRPITNIHKMMESMVMDDEAMEDCESFGRFIAYFRSRPSKKQDEEKKTRELSTRLVSQLTKLAYLMAGVMNKKNVDEEIISRMRKLTLDTARGNTLEMIKQLDRYSESGLEAKTLAHMASLEEEKTRHLLRFLKANGVVETFKPQLARGVSGNLRYRLTEKIRDLYERVMHHPSKDLH